MYTHGRPDVVMSDAGVPVQDRLLEANRIVNIVYSLPVQDDCGPALKSFPPRPKTRRLKSASIAMHGDASTALVNNVEINERTTKVSGIMICTAATEKLQVVVDVNEDVEGKEKERTLDEATVIYKEVVTDISRPLIFTDTRGPVPVNNESIRVSSLYVCSPYQSVLYEGWFNALKGRDIASDVIVRLRSMFNLRVIAFLVRRQRPNMYQAPWIVTTSGHRYSPCEVGQWKNRKAKIDITGVLTP